MKRLEPYVVMAVLSLCLSVVAQTPLNDPGFPNFVPMDSHEFDSINLMTNNIVVNAPLISKGGFIPINTSLVGNFSLTASTAWSTGGVGFSLNGPSIVGATSTYYTGPVMNGVCMVDQSQNYKYSNFYLYGADGVSHPLLGGTANYILTGSRPGTGPPCNTTQTWQTADGSGYTVQWTGDSSLGANPYLNYIVDRSGNYYNPHSSTAVVTDPFGNSITKTVSTNTTWTDTMGVNAFTQTLSGHTTTYSWTDINSGTPGVSVAQTSKTVKTVYACTSPAITDINAVATYLPTTVTLADGRTIGVAYDATNGFPSDVTGRLGTLTLPTGGYITYAYSGGHNEVDCTYQNPPTITRTLSNGDVTTYTLSHNLISGSNYNAKNVVIDPGGNETDYIFTGFSSTGMQAWPVAQVVTEIKRYQGKLSGTYTLLSDDVYCYAAPASCSFSTASTAINSYPILQVTVMHKLCLSSCGTATPTMTSAAMTYTGKDGFGDITVAQAYDFGAATPTTETDITYGSCTASCSSTSPTISSMTSTAGYPINDRPGKVRKYQYSGATAYLILEANYTYNTNGALLSMKVSPDGGTTWLGQSTSNVINSNGTPSKTYDLANNETDYTYSAGSYSQCTSCTAYPFPTQVKDLGTGDYISYTYDGTGGVVNTATDRNGAVTTYGYSTAGGTADPLWRVMSVTDPDHNIVYDAYPTSSSNNSGYSFTFGGSIEASTMTADALDRPIRVQVNQSPSGSNYDTVSTGYAWAGNYQQVQTSQPCSTTMGNDCTLVHTSKFDPLGRLYTMSTTSNETLTHTYAGQDDTAVLSPAPSGEKAKETITEFDGLGRAKETCRYGNGVGTTCTLASGNQTGDPQTFTYTASTGQTSVTASRGSQSRTIYYDGLGRVIKRVTPEGGTWTYVYDSNTACPTGYRGTNGKLASSHDSNGNLICNAYDSLGRLTGVNANGTTCRHFYYDNSTGYSGSYPSGVSAPTNSFGRMVEAATDTCASNTLITDEWFSYEQDGLMTDMWEKTPHSTQYYHSKATFFGNGQVNTLQLASPSLYTMTYTLEGEGRWNTLTDTTSGQALVSGTSSFPASNPSTINLTGTDNDSYSFDSNTGRVTQFVFTVGNTPKSLTGSVNWNGNGTLANLAITDGFNASGTQTCHFDSTLPGGIGYDDWGRLLGADCGAGQWGQTFSYDIYENLTKTQMSGRPGTTWNPGYSSTNNYCSTCTYDANGDVRSDGNANYFWNEFSKLASAATSGTPTCGSSGRCLTYDAFGRIVEQSFNSTWTTRWITQLGETLYMNGTTPKYAYWPAPGGSRVLLYGNGAGYDYLHTDWLGNVRIDSDLVAHQVDTDQAYTPYGEIYNIFGSNVGQNEIFASMTSDFFPSTTTPLMYDTPNREFSLVSRWLSPDPAGVGWNQYAYSTNPLTFIDPTGLGPCSQYDKNGRPQAPCNRNGNEGAVPGGASCTLDGIPVTCAFALAGIDEFDLMNIPVILPNSIYNPPTSWTITTTSYDSEGNQIGDPFYTFGVENGGWQDLGSGLNILPIVAANNGNFSWWGAFAGNLFSVKNFVDEFKPGGCVNEFIEGADSVDILGPVTTGHPDLSEENMIATATSGAAFYYASGAGPLAASHALVCPGCSTIYQSILGTGAKLAEGAGAVLLFAQSVAGSIREGRAIVNGECH